MIRPLTLFIPHCSDVLSDYRPHGDGRIAHGFLTSLARRGHRLHVAVEEVDVREPLHPNITVYQIARPSKGRVLWRAEYMARVRALLNRLKREVRFDLIHQMNPVYTGLSLALAGSGVPVVLGTYVARWPDDSDNSERLRSLGRTLSWGRDQISVLQQRMAVALILTTPAAMNRLPQPETVRDRIRLLSHGLDTQEFSPESEWDAPARTAAHQARPVILFLANVVEKKGIFTLIEAFRAVARAFPTCVLRIAGDGNQMEELRRRVAALDCAAQVEILGRQERSRAPELYRQSAIYCLPSYGEPYATTALEAMSCARALVVTNEGGLPYVAPKEGGLHVPVRDADALASALIHLLRNPEERVRMGRFNRARVESEMSWEKVAERLEVIYEKALVRKGRETGKAWASSSLKPQTEGIDSEGV